MDDIDAEEVWQFNFFLEPAAKANVERAKADELMNLIIAWAEANDCQIGGGYKTPPPENANPEELFPLDG